MPKQEDKFEQDGIVKEAKSARQFVVEFSNGHKVNANLSGKMSKNYIHIAPGDRVKVKISHYDLSKGLITYRNIDRKNQ